jgi:signal transduction histidine kinase
VQNEPAILPVAQRHGGGHGLIAMHERASAAGGTVVTGPRDDGGYWVHARLPLAPVTSGVKR